MKKTKVQNRIAQNLNKIFTPILPWATLLGILAFIFLCMGLWYRWLRPDPVFLSFTANMVGILTIATFLGLQTRTGQTFVIDLNRVSGMKALNSPAWRCLVIWMLVLFASLGLWAGSPLAAESYRSKGVAYSEDGNNSAAIRAFSQAISLDPKNARSHYNLAVAWESIYDYESAIGEYKIALELDANFWPAYNNLGRLLLSQPGNLEAGLSVLITGQHRTDNPLGYAVLTKNLSLAYFEAGLYATALEVVNDAIQSLLKLHKDGNNTEVYLADAYRLQAKIFMTQQATREAANAWNDSLGYSLALTESQDCKAAESQFPQYCADAIQWSAEAREALLNLEKDPDGK